MRKGLSASIGLGDPTNRTLDPPYRDSLKKFSSSVGSGVCLVLPLTGFVVVLGVAADDDDDRVATGAVDGQDQLLRRGFGEGTGDIVFPDVLVRLLPLLLLRQAKSRSVFRVQRPKNTPPPPPFLPALLLLLLSL